MRNLILPLLLLVCGIQVHAKNKSPAKTAAQPAPVYVQPLPQPPPEPQSPAVIAHRAAWVRKASILLTGKEGYHTYELEQALGGSDEDWTKYQTEALKQLFASDEFSKKMTTEILEHLGLPTEVYYYDANIKFVASQHIKRILNDGAPWSSLFNSREVFYNGRNRQHVQFYKRLFGAALNVPDFNFPPEADISKSEFNVIRAKDPGLVDAVAGFFTTPDFFSRYFNTGTNENRKRAAAMYRILLCDEMKPVILSDAHLERELLLATMNDLTGQGQKQIEPVVGADQHATNPECQVCHRKLEPAGKLFQTSPKSPTRNSLATQFVFGSQSQNVLGIGQWVDAALKSDASRRCQVRFFWNYTIGKNVPLSDDQMNELLKIYDAKNENVQAMLTELIQRREFSATAQQLENRPVTFSDVRPLLQRCDSCHSGESTMPDFGSLPFDKDPARHTSWLKRIAKETDLLHMGAKSTMPPAKAGWKPTTMEYRLLAKWIADGARDEKGVPTLAEPVLNEGVKLGITEATFLPTFRRYLRQRDLVFIAYANYQPKLSSTCVSFAANNGEPIATAVDLGAYSFNKLAPLLEVPGPAYFTYLARCAAPGMAKNYLSRTNTASSLSVKLDGAQDLAMAEALFEQAFGKFRFYGVRKEIMVKRTLTAARGAFAGESEVPAEELALKLAVAITSLPEFSTY